MFDIGIILLAAGNSSRMGSAKQLMNFRGKPLLRRAAESACHSNCNPVVAVLGAHELDVRPVLVDLPLEVAINELWCQGIGTSIKAGVQTLSNRPIRGVIIALADQPFVTSAVLSRLAEQQARTQKPIVASRYSETVGAPAFFSSELFPKLLALEPDQGCKTVVLDFIEKASLIHCPEAAVDIDTPIDHARATMLADIDRSKTAMKSVPFPSARLPSKRGR